MLCSSAQKQGSWLHPAPSFPIKHDTTFEGSLSGLHVWFAACSRGIR